MKRLILYFIVLLISVWLGIKIHANPGYILISYQHWSIETTLWFGVLMLIIALIIIYILWRVLHLLLALSGRWQRWTSKRQARKARRLTSRGLCELAEGNWKKSEKYLTRGAIHSETPLINYLAAARAAQGQQKYENRDRYLSQAHDCTEDSEEVAVGLTQAQLQLNSKQLERALATLRHLNQLVPHHSYVLKLLKTVYLELYGWEGLRDLLPELCKYNVLNAVELHQLETNVYLALLATAEKTPEQLTSFWQEVPHHLQKESVLLSAYANSLVKQNRENEAEELLRDALKKNWSAELMTQYGRAQGNNPAKQLAFAESLLKTHSHEPALLLSLGQICARHQLWGKARHYLESSLKYEQRLDTYRELGGVLEQLGDKQAALNCYRTGLQLI